MKRPAIHTYRVHKILLLFNIFMALVYFSWWFVPGHMGNPFLYALLFFGEIYHVFMAIAFWFTIWPGKKESENDRDTTRYFVPSVDVYIPVSGEPIEIIRKTAQAAKNMDYGNHSVYILNDAFVAGGDNWQEVEVLAQELGVGCITRTQAGGAKAGNINHALRKTKGEIIVIFDADMVPYPEFLRKVIPFFARWEKVGFVQTPQFYNNSQMNAITRGAWEQQEFFFGPILRGKEKSNATFICGTNVAIRRQALEEVGGMCEDNIAEDFLTSLFIHQNGWRSYYVPDVLVAGLAPEDMLSYYKQQLRWARGSLEVLFAHNPLFKKGLTFSQKIQYLSSALYYFNGVIVLIDILMPLIFLFFGTMPVNATTTSFALFFIPFMFLNLYTLHFASGRSMTFRAISFSQSSWTLQLSALKSLLLKQKPKFEVTSKKALSGNFLFLAYPHLIYIAIALIASFVGILREGLNPSIMTNVAWVAFNIVLFTPFIHASVAGSSSSENLKRISTSHVAHQTSVEK